MRGKLNPMFQISQFLWTLTWEKLFLSAQSELYIAEQLKQNRVRTSMIFSCSIFLSSIKLTTCCHHKVENNQWKKSNLKGKKYQIPECKHKKVQQFTREINWNGYLNKESGQYPTPTSNELNDMIPNENPNLFRTLNPKLRAANKCYGMVIKNRRDN